MAATLDRVDYCSSYLSARSVAHIRSMEYHPSDSSCAQAEDGVDAPAPLISYEEQAAEAHKVRGFTNSIAGGRRGSVSARPVSASRVHTWQAPMHPKAPEHEIRIKDAIKTNDKLQVLFGHLSEMAIQRVVGAFFYRQVEAGDIVIQQCADGDFFYIVDSGLYNIFVQRRADIEPELVMQAGAGMAFGELALMYNVPRAATVRSAMPGGLWCLDRESFQMMLVTSENSKVNQYTHFLRNVPLLNELTDYEISIVSDLLDQEPFGVGEPIIQQGELGSTFYFLYEGECKAYMNGPQGEVEVCSYTHPGQYFGEIALITNEPRRATVRASGPDGCTVLVLRREDVDLSVGSVQERFMANIQRYPEYEAIIRQQHEANDQLPPPPVDPLYYQQQQHYHAQY